MTEKQEIQLRLVCAPEHFPSETTCETPIKVNYNRAQA